MPKSQMQHAFLIKYRHRFTIIRAAALLETRLQLPLPAEVHVCSSSVILRSVRELLDATTCGGPISVHCAGHTAT